MNKNDSSSDYNPNKKRIIKKKNEYIKNKLQGTSTPSIGYPNSTQSNYNDKSKFIIPSSIPNTNVIANNTINPNLTNNISNIPGTVNTNESNNYYENNGEMYPMMYNQMNSNPYNKNYKVNYIPNNQNNLNNINNVNTNQKSNQINQVGHNNFQNNKLVNKGNLTINNNTYQTITQIYSPNINNNYNFNGGPNKFSNSTNQIPYQNIGHIPNVSNSNDYRSEPSNFYNVNDSLNEDLANLNQFIPHGNKDENEAVKNKDKEIFKSIQESFKVTENISKPQVKNSNNFMVPEEKPKGKFITIKLIFII